MDDEKIIEDLIAGARRAGARVERKTGGGLEEKLAALGGGLGGVVGPIGATLGAGVQDDSVRSGLGAGLGSLIGGPVGGLLGNLGGAALAGPLHVDPRQLAALGLLGGSIGGSALGGHVGQSVARPDREREKQSALADAYSAGERAALDRFKVAFLGAIAPLIGSIAGPALARGALARAAPMAAKAIGSGMKGQLFDAAASTVGGMAGQKLTGPVG